MRSIFILAIMFFLHVFADYHLQGILATLKQRDKWPQTLPENTFIWKNDYKAALAAHAFEWSFVVTLPCLASIFHVCSDFSWPNIRIGTVYIAWLVLNAILHYIIDDLKANDKSINLITDQLAHVVQVFITWLLWTSWIGW